MLRELGETRLRVGATDEPARELDVETVVTGFAREERSVEGAHRGVGHALREELEPLAAACLDQRRDAQQVEQTPGLVAAYPRVQGHAVGARSDRLVSRAAGVEDLEYLLKMLELFARELGEGLLQEAVMRVGEEKLDGRPGRLLLAVRVIEEHLVEVRLRAWEPVGVGRGGQVEHGAGVYQHPRTAQRSDPSC